MNRSRPTYLSRYGSEPLSACGIEAELGEKLRGSTKRQRRTERRPDLEFFPRSDAEFNQRIVPDSAKMCGRLAKSPFLSKAESFKSAEKSVLTRHGKAADEAPHLRLALLERSP